MLSAIRSVAPGSLNAINQAHRAYQQSLKDVYLGRTNEPDQIARSIKFESARREVVQRRLNQNQLQSLIQTADATLNDITPALYRIHELALRGLNTVISEEERVLIHNEAKGIESWVNASVNSVQFNGESLFDHHLNIQSFDDGYTAQI